jgi:hypothetical protein
MVGVVKLHKVGWATLLKSLVENTEKQVSWFTGGGEVIIHGLEYK